jgi:hypothetical protein
VGEEVPVSERKRATEIEPPWPWMTQEARDSNRQAFENAYARYLMQLEERSQRFRQTDAVDEIVTAGDAFEAHLRSLLNERPTVRIRDFAVDEPPPRLSWWQRVKLMWRFLW